MDTANKTYSIDWTCDGCGNTIPAGTQAVVTMLKGRERNTYCATCGAAKRVELAALAEAFAPLRTVAEAAKQPTRAYAKRMPKSYRPAERSLACTCRNCRSGRESLCLRDS